MDSRLVYTVYDFDSVQTFCSMSKIIKILVNLEVFDMQHDFLNFQKHSEIFVCSQMIIPNLTEKDIFEKGGIHWDFLEKNAIENQENGGTMMLDSSSVPVEDEAYFQIFDRQVYAWSMVSKAAYLKIKL
jgi:hypothetical protein